MSFCYLVCLLKYVRLAWLELALTEFVRLIAWEKLAEICSQYLAKGKLIYAEGRLQTRSWEDKSGNKRYTTEIVLSNMQMLDKRGTVEETPNNQEDPPF